MAEIKVTDKRMFTPDGRLRDDLAQFGHETTAIAEAEKSPFASPAPVPEAPPLEAVREPEVREASMPVGEGPRLEIPGTPPGFGAPTFYDLVAVLAEPVSIYLGDVSLPDGQTAENLEMARLHIDLLDLLRHRTAGNLLAQEKSVLEDLIYRLRLRYVQKRG